MLPEIFAEALHFLTRRDLDKACAVNKWLDSLIAQCCDVYPLRPVTLVGLYPHGSSHMVVIEEQEATAPDAGGMVVCRMDEAVHLVGSILRHSYVDLVELGAFGRRLALSPGHWTTLIDAIGGGAIRRFRFEHLDFSPLSADAFLAAIGCHGLQSLMVLSSVIPVGSITDNLIRFSAARGVFMLFFSKNICDAPHRLSDDSILNFFFREDAAPGGESLTLWLEGTGITDMFFASFFERLLTSRLRPSGRLMFDGAAKQRGLSTFARYLEPGSRSGQYRLPSIDVDEKSFYNVVLSEGFSYMDVQFHFAQLLYW